MSRIPPPPSGVEIIQVGEGEGTERWDAYVSPRAYSVTDLAAWCRVVAETYGLRSWLLAAVEGERFVGSLGLFEVRHPIFGHYLATAPFGNDGGLHFDTESVRDNLLSEARAVADRLDVDYLLIRTRDQALDGYCVDSHYRTAVLKLDGGAETVWKHTLPAKTRNQIRRGMKEGFTVETGHSQLGAFYDVFHEHMRDLGSPAHSRKFYESIVEHLGERVEFLVVRDGAIPAAGAMLLWINGTAMNLHTVALRRFNRRCPNYLIYWKMIEESCAHGCVRFDMGRSEADSPNLSFKMNWGPEPVTLCYNYYLRKLRDIPYVDPRNPRYRLPIAVWRRLPLAVTQRLGPRLIAGLI